MAARVLGVCASILVGTARFIVGGAGACARVFVEVVRLL